MKKTALTQWLKYTIERKEVVLVELVSSSSSFGSTFTQASGKVIVAITDFFFFLFLSFFPSYFLYSFIWLNLPSRFLGKEYFNYYVTRNPNGETGFIYELSSTLLFYATQWHWLIFRSVSSVCVSSFLLLLFLFSYTTDQMNERHFEERRKKRKRRRRRKRKEREGNLSGDTEEREKEIPLELASGQWDAKIGLCPAFATVITRFYWVCIQAVTRDNQFSILIPRFSLNQYYFVLELEGIHSKYVVLFAWHQTSNP